MVTEKQVARIVCVYSYEGGDWRAHYAGHDIIRQRRAEVVDTILDLAPIGATVSTDDMGSSYIIRLYVPV